MSCLDKLKIQFGGEQERNRALEKVSMLLLDCILHYQPRQFERLATHALRPLRRIRLLRKCADAKSSFFESVACRIPS